MTLESLGLNWLRDKILRDELSCYLKDAPFFAKTHFETATIFPFSKSDQTCRLIDKIVFHFHSEFGPNLFAELLIRIWFLRI